MAAIVVVTLFYINSYSSQLYTNVHAKLIKIDEMCYEWATASIVLILTQLRRSGFNSEFETCFESIYQGIADLWQRKGENVVASKTALTLFSSDVEILKYSQVVSDIFYVFKMANSVAYHCHSF